MPAELKQPAPDFELATLDGQTHHLSDYRGDIVGAPSRSPLFFGNISLFADIVHDTRACEKGTLAE